MFTSFTIKNFRCFASLRLLHLGRVNLISGKNNTGKTAVLEAIQIHNRPNDCIEAFSVAKYRGVGESISLDVGAWLFNRNGLENEFEVSTCDEANVKRVLTIYLIDSEVSRERFPNVEKGLREYFHPDVSASATPRLVLRYEESNQSTQFSFGTSGGVGFQGHSARIPWNQKSIFIGSTPLEAKHDLRLFGELEASKRQEEVLPALRLVEPRLQRCPWSLSAVWQSSTVMWDCNGSSLST